MKGFNWFSGIVFTKGGTLVVLILLSLLDASFLSGFASDFFDFGDTQSGLIAFALFTILGLMMVSMIKLVKYFLETMMIEKTEDSPTAEKSISSEDFNAAMQKMQDEIRSAKEGSTPHDLEQVPNYIFVRVDGKIFKVLFDSILYAEANRNYTKIVLQDSVLKPTITFNSLEELLPKKFFFRLHRSFIINKSKISHIEGNRVLVGEKEIPIGANYKDEFMRDIGLAQR